MNELLTFQTLDGLAFAAERGRLDRLPDVSTICVERLGPLIEWVTLTDAGLLPGPEDSPYLSLDGAAPLVAALRGERRQWVCPATRARGIFRTPAKWPNNDTEWIGFGLAAQKAAIATGFHMRIAAQFVGAMQEMVSNIYEHSGAPGTGIVAFRASRDEFEFVVADCGIGVLDSLRLCPEYKDLTDYGAALQLALNDGVSRFGTAARRGNGFRPIFVGLANLSGTLRFRSGDHALVIDGEKMDAMLAKTAQKAHLNGLLASVACRVPS